jgi:hypothetical protein
MGMRGTRIKRRVIKDIGGKTRRKETIRKTKT